MMGAEDKEESGEGQVDSVGDQDDSKNNDNNVDEMDMDEARPEATLTYKVGQVISHVCCSNLKTSCITYTVYNTRMDKSGKPRAAEQPRVGRRG